MAELRKYIRVNKNIHVTYSIVNQILKSSARSQDVSEGGICIPSKLRFDKGIVLALDISLPGEGKPIKAQGEVVWLREVNNFRFPFMLGVKFVSIDSSDLDKIRDFIQRLPPQDIQWME